MSVAPERAAARIDLAAVQANAALLRSRLTGGADLCAVVKADGYGHGAFECARAALAGGAGWLAVATAAEAIDLRSAGLLGPRLLVMGAVTAADLVLVVGADADVVVWDAEFVPALVAAAGSSAVRVHVKLDTGMGRLGAADRSAADAVVRAVIERDELELVGLMTHFATADEDGDDHFPAQLGRFDDFARAVRADHPDLVAHAANSAALFREDRAHFDMARCGIALYGLDPANRETGVHGLRPALSLASHVAMVKPFAEGRSAGYGRTWQASVATQVGVVPIGYGDGVRRALGNVGEVLVRGLRRPIVGTVSMDNLTIDLGRGTDVRVGDEVVLIGEQDGDRLGAEDMAARLDTINYEIACGISARVPRRFGPG